MTEASDEQCDVLEEVFPGERDAPWEPSEKLPIIVKEIDKLKLELKNFIKESDSNITELLEESEALCQESRELSEELHSCEQEIEHETMSEVLKSIQDHDAIALDLEKVTFSLNIVFDVVHCGKYLKEYDDYIRAENFNAAAERLSDITHFLTTPADGFKYLTMYEALKTSVELHWDSLVQELSRRFDQMISWDVVQHTEKRFHVTINLNIFDRHSDIDILLALNMCKHLQPKVAAFAQFLLKEVLGPLVHSDCSLTEESPERISLIVNKGSMRPIYDRALITLRHMLRMINEKLNLEVEAGVTIMSMIGKEIGVELGDVIVKDCLIHTIPSSVGELKEYHNVIGEARSLQKYLQDIHIFPKENFTILHYAHDLDTSFANKICQRFLEKARRIMLKDLSTSMSIGVESVPQLEEQPAVMEASVDEAIQILDAALPKSLYYFPRCMISRTTQELLNLVHAMMEQAAQCSDLACRRLYVTTRMIFELYQAVVPYHHENYLLTIPQYVALFHNNCMYLAHNLLMLGEKWTMQLEERTVDYPISFLDLVPELRNLGYKHLTIHLQQQRKQILDNIRCSDLNCIVVKDVLGENAEQAIRQCLRQLQLLKNVWIGVFPPNVFTRLMACLVNMFIEEIIHRVCTVEDISAEMANQLTDMYTIVVKKAPNLFQKEKDLIDNVKCWVKLQELIIVLGGSLKDIEKRWADGAGPLAVHFRVEELRSLIKALFQNTQFRANLLVKIK